MFVCLFVYLFIYHQQTDTTSDATHHNFGVSTQPGEKPRHDSSSNRSCRSSGNWRSSKSEFSLIEFIKDEMFCDRECRKPFAVAAAASDRLGRSHGTLSASLRPPHVPPGALDTAETGGAVAGAAAGRKHSDDNVRKHSSPDCLPPVSHS